MSNSIHVSQSQQDFLNASRRRYEMEARQFKAGATPQKALSLAQFSTLYPNNSSTLAVMLTVNGVPPDSDMVRDLADTELENRETLGPHDSAGGGFWDALERGVGEFVLDPIKGSVRWGMMGLMSVYESTVGGSLYRAQHQAHTTGRGLTGEDSTLYEQQPFLTRALGDAFRDPAATWNSMWGEATTRDAEQEAMLRAGTMQQTVNAGSGFFANSTVDPEVEQQVMERSAAFDQTLSGLPQNEAYSKRLEQSPQIWRDAVEGSSYQAALGAPMTQQGYADREGVMFNLPNAVTGTSFRTPYSPGRFAAATIFEPGTAAFSRVSGVGDIGAQIFLDPMNLAGAYWAKAGKAGRTVRAVMNKVTGAANDITDSARAAMEISGFRGIKSGVKDPIEAFGGAILSDIDIEKIKQANSVLTDVQRAMLDESVHFNDPDAFYAWMNMRKRVEKLGVDFDDIDQVRIIESLSDSTMGVLDNARVQVGDTTRKGGPTDVPEAHYAATYPRDVIGDVPKRKRVSAGHHRIGDTNIRGKSGKWTVDGIDNQTFKTLAEAEARVNEDIARGISQLEPSAEAKAFRDEYDDIFVGDGAVDELNTIDTTNRQGQQAASRSGTSKRPEGGNAKVRVYGKTVDVSGTSLPADLPKEVEQALRNAGMWSDSVGYIGFADEAVSHIPESVTRTLAQHGYGKIKVSSNEWTFLDEFIGGNKSDPFGRIFFDDGKRAIASKQGYSGTAGTTPNQINDHIGWLQAMGRHGLDESGNLDPAKLTREAMDEFRRTNAEKIDAARAAVDDGDALGSTISGVRPDIDEAVGTLTGKRADALITDFAKASEMDDAPARIDRMLRYFDRNRIKIPRNTREKLMRADGNRSKVESALAEWIGPHGDVVLQGGTRYGRMRGAVGAIDDILNSNMGGYKARGGRGVFGRVADRPAIARRFSMMIPTKEVNLVDNPDEAYIVLNSMLTNYNIKRGQEAIEYVNDAGKTVRTRGIEEVMGEMRMLEQGDKAASYRLMGDYSQILFAQATKDMDGKVSDALIRQVTGFFDETGRMHVYNTERMGMVELAEGVGDMLRMGGDPTYLPGVNFTTEAWTGGMHFPNARSVKRVMNYRDRVGSVSNFLMAKKVYKPELTGEWAKLRKAAKAEMKDRPKIGSLKEAKQIIRDGSADFDLVDRAGTMVMRGAINKLWKPVVLLRGAWTIRIMIDDQMRVAAEGYDTIFNHPFRFINYALSQPTGSKNPFKTGFIDLDGVRVSMKNIDEVGFGKFYSDAMMSMSDGIFGKGAYGSKFATQVAKGQKFYNEGMATRLSQLGSDPMNNLLVSSKADDPVKEVVEWLLGNRPALNPRGVAGKKYREQLAQLKGEHAEIAKAIQDGDLDTLNMLVGRYHADLHRATGGVVVYNDGMGNYRHYVDKETIVTNIGDDVLAPPAKFDNPSGQFYPEVKVKGDAELLDVLKTGNIKDIDGNVIARLHKADDRTLSNQGYKEFRNLIGRKVKEADADRFPTHASAPDPSRGAYPDGIGAAYDRGLANFFDIFMSKPSNWLSRSPVFEQAYWRHVGEIMPLMDDATAAAFMKRADAAGATKAVKRSANRTRKWSKGDPEASGYLSPRSKLEFDELVETIDEQAKAMGLAQVERTLFDLSTKRNISDSMSLIFPFVEAWGEFISRWGRLAVYGDRNIKTMNRLQQGVNGLRESDPFDPQGDQGFFHENDFGQEVFSYPAAVTKGGIMLHNLMASIPGMSGFVGAPIDPNLADQIKVTGTAESLNFASGVIPGFGPAFQIASQVVLNEDPKWDPIKNIISPFGELTGPTSLAPGWVKRVMAANQNPDPALNAMYMNTVQDIIRTMQMNGEFNEITTKEQFSAKIKIAEERAKGLLMVRAAATWILPSSPQYTFQKEDKTGKVWAYSQIGQAYNDILYNEAGSNKNEAFQIFHERYGYLPTSFTQARTYSIKERSTSVEGYRFERANAQLFEKYSDTARFLMEGASTDEEFSYSRHLALLNEGLKEQWTPEQQVSASDDLLGDLIWDNTLRGLDYIRKAGEMEEYDAKIAEARDQIAQLHPYWGQIAPPGKRTTATNEDQILEVERWMADPNLQGRGVVEAARQYLQTRNKYISMLEGEGMTLSGTYLASEWKTAITMRIRNDLRTLADNLGQGTPEFAILWRNVFAQEISQQHDGFEAQSIDFYGEDLFETTMGFSRDDEPQFNPRFGGYRKSSGTSRFIGA